MSGIFAGLLAASAIARVFVEDVFSTYLYTGGSVQTITNGIDLAGKGGLVWIKSRGSLEDHYLYDTNRGVNIDLNSNGTNPNQTVSGSLTSFGSSGFTLGTNEGGINGGGGRFVSWTFRKAPKFFDIVTWTANDTYPRAIPHSLGIKPGFIVFKQLNGADDWYAYHQSQGASKFLRLNTTGASVSGTGPWWGVEPTATDFTVGNFPSTAGNTYVAYLFAHDPSADGTIQCGSYTGNGSATGPVVTLGWEPQWVLVKNTNASSDWYQFDNMRGMPVGANDLFLRPNLTSIEAGTGNFIDPTATGFNIMSASSAFNTNGTTYIYMAIRRGPMRTPTLGTSVFYPQTVAQTDTPDSSGVPFPPDLVNTFSRNGTNRTSEYDNFLFVDRLRSLGVPSNTYSSGTGGRALVSSSTGAELSAADSYVQLKADSQNITRGGGWNNPLYGNMIYYFFRRAPSFMDVVCYTGDGSTSQTVNHNLGVEPELIILKCRNVSNDGGATNGSIWNVAVKAGSTAIHFAIVGSQGLNFNGASTWSEPWVNIFATATSFRPYYITGAFTTTPAGATSGNTYVAYLFASAPGVSKVGTYTGNGSSQTINCAFTTGARFVLIKRTDSTGDWYVWDSARGIVAGNDPYLALNSTAAEVTTNDSVDTDNTGFIVNQVGASNINVNAATYIFLAIA